MIADKDFLTPLVDAMQEKDVGFVGPTTYCFPEREKLYSAGGDINFWKGRMEERVFTLKRKEVSCLNGCFLIKREVIQKIGYFYEPYFLIFEEIDYCMQAKKAGYKILCEPKSVIWHKTRRTLSKMSSLETYYSYRNKFLFMKRNAPFYIKYPFYLYCSAFLILTYARRTVFGEKEIANYMIKGVVDFWLGKFGERQ